MTTGEFTEPLRQSYDLS